MIHLPLRSVLFVPAASEKAMAKVATLEADALILDLEDSAGEAEKTEALRRVTGALEAGGFVAPLVLVRVDPARKAAALVALTRYVGHGLNGYVIPKVGAAVHLTGYEAPVWAMIETAKGVLNLKEICTAPGLQGLIAGPNDLRADLRVSPTPERTELQLSLSNIVLHARAFGLSVIDGVYNTFRDDEGLRRECENGRALGFDGKTLIHPAQIAVTNAVFAPTEGQLDWARAVVAAFAQPENLDKGVVSVNGEMVERMHLATARRWLASPLP